MIKAELISQVWHYANLARPLWEAGFLQRFVLGPAVLDGERWPWIFGKRVAERLYRERTLCGMPASAVKRIWACEMVRQVLSHRAAWRPAANLMHDEYFGRRASMLIKGYDVLHFTESAGLEAARKLGKNGPTIICDERAEHPRFQEAILREETDLLGLRPGDREAFRQRALQELEFANYIIVPSSHAKRTFVAQGYPEDIIFVCPYGVDLAQFTQRAVREDEETLTIVFVGQIDIRKGVHYLLEGFRRAKLKNAKLLLVGTIAERFRVILDRYQGMFEYLGQVRHSQIHSVYQRASVFVLASLADAYPLVAIEAMASGVPVIITENTGTADLVKDGVNGFIVPIRDPDALAGRLTYLYENRERCWAMGEAAASVARTQTWDAYGDRMCRFYRERIAKSH